MKGKNKIRYHVKLDKCTRTDKIWCSPVNHVNICAFTVITGNLTHTSSINKLKIVPNENIYSIENNQ